MDLLLDEAALLKLPSLRPRDCDYVALDVTSARGLFLFLSQVSPVACLLAASVAGPALREALVARLGGGAEAEACCAFLSGGWLPSGAVPHVGEPLVTWLDEIALGAPGDPVAHGKTPSRATKLARLLRARAGAYPRRRVLEAARRAYEGPYNAHDAVACAFVGVPGEALRVAGELVASREKSTSIRRATAEVVLWATRAGYAPRTVLVVPLARGSAPVARGSAPVARGSAPPAPVALESADLLPADEDPGAVARASARPKSGAEG